jgi:hypothetical protein
MHAVDGFGAGHAAQDFLGDLRQQGAREDVVHVARAAFHFPSPAGDLLHQCLVVGHLGPMVFRHALLDAAELQLDDLAQHLIGNGEVRHDDQSSQERRLERIGNLSCLFEGGFSSVSSLRASDIVSLCQLGACLAPSRADFTAREQTDVEFLNFC